MLLVARTAQQSRVPRPGAAPAGRGRRDAGGGRGALHLRLGPRLPTRLPAAAHPVGASSRRAIPVLATTATANTRVVRTSPSNSGPAREPETSGAPRPAGPDQPPPRGGAPPRPRQQRLAWLAEHLGDLPGSGIIYTLTVAAAVETAGYLRERVRRRPLQRRATTRPSGWRRGGPAGQRLKALVATRALGMGFDKPDLGFVVHLGRPAVARSPITSRSAEPDAAWTAPRSSCCRAREDEAIWAYFASLAFPPESPVRDTLAALDDRRRGAEHQALETGVDLSRDRVSR